MTTRLAYQDNREINTGSLEIDGESPEIKITDCVVEGRVDGGWTTDSIPAASSNVTTTTEAGYKSERVISIFRTNTGIISGEIRRAVKNGHHVTAGNRRGQNWVEFRRLGPVIFGVANNRLSIGRLGLKKALDLK